MLLLAIFLLIVTGCGNRDTVTSEDLAQYEVKQTFDEQGEDDFIFRLVSGKEQYGEGEEIELYGEIFYTGGEELTIYHASSAIIFTITEEIRGHRITSAVQEIGAQSILKPVPQKPYRENYRKQGVFQSDTDSDEYNEFIEEFLDTTSFPTGYYVVEAMTSFHDGNENREIKAKIDFKVNAGTEGE